MRNREKYISKRNEYDLMMAISQNAFNIYWHEDQHTYCSIAFLTGKIPTECRGQLCCEECIQHWLNAEAD